MFALGNASFACGVRSARERSFEEASGKMEVGRRSLLPLRTRPQHANRTQLEPATSAGVILPKTGQFLVLCSLQLWQQLRRCPQTRARVQVFLTHFTSVLHKQLTASDTFLREANGYKRALAAARVKKRTAGVRLFLRPSCQSSNSDKVSNKSTA